MVTGYEREFYRNVDNIADRLQRIDYALDRIANALEEINVRQQKVADANRKE